MKINRNIALTYDDVTLVPRYSEVSSRKLCSTESRVSKRHVLPLPVCASPMDTVTEYAMAKAMSDAGGMGFIHRFCTIADQCVIVSKLKLAGVIPIGAAIGVRGDYLERAIALQQAGCDILLIDIAHGHHASMELALKALKDKLGDSVDVIAGNVATADGTMDLISWGADGIRVNVGSGSLCTTRLNAGTGIPCVTSVLECAEVAKLYSIPIMADGGIRYPGDIAKALACGASCVMCGAILAGTDEAPGDIYKIEGKEYKLYQGAASSESKFKRGEELDNIEGESAYVPYKGRVVTILDGIRDGLRSALSYSGVDNVIEFKENAILRQVTGSGIIEAQPHLKRSLGVI